jgi:hypothetical protein
MQIKGSKYIIFGTHQCYQLIIHVCSATDLRKTNLCKFSSFFWIFSVKRPDGLSFHPDGCRSDGQTVLLYVRTHAAQTAGR